jgi:hypothetical protein
LISPYQYINTNKNVCQQSNEETRGTMHGSVKWCADVWNTPRLISTFFASGGQGALFEKTAPWTPAKTFDLEAF